MTKKPPSFLDRFSPSTRVAAGAGLVGILLTMLIFMPGGLLDSITSPSSEVASDEQAGDLLVNEAEAEIPAELSQAKNEQYLADNAKKEGVKVTASGLQYREVKAGTGKQPGPDSTVTVHYKGTFITGKEFDSSLGGEPISFALTQVIKGWTEGLQLMREGGKAELVIPQDIAYGPGRQGIPPYQTLVFEIELLKVE